MEITENMKMALDYLGEPYEVQTIDFEDCLYRNLNNGFDVEVSGISDPRKANACNYVQVWDIRDGANYTAKTVEIVRDVRTLPELKAVLDQLCEKYGNDQEYMN